MHIATSDNAVAITQPSMGSKALPLLVYAQIERAGQQATAQHHMPCQRLGKAVTFPWRVAADQVDGMGNACRPSVGCAKRRLLLCCSQMGGDTLEGDKKDSGAAQA